MPFAEQASFLAGADAPTPGPAKAGIARMAAEAEPEDERRKIDFAWIDCRSIVNRVDGTRARFEWSINPYRGCEYGCVYCYARYTHEFMDLSDPFDFERHIFMKRGAAARLRKELAEGRIKPGETVVFGAATDPYQPAEKRFELTRALLEVIAQDAGYGVGITTKSDLILRDLALLRRIGRRHRLRIHMTVTTTDPALARETEPRAVVPERRMEAVARLREAGIAAGVNLMPIMPGINDGDAQLEAVFERAARARAAFVMAGTLWLTKSSWARHLIYLKERRPELVPQYAHWYGGATDAPDHYKRQIAAKLEALRVKYRLPARAEEPEPALEPAPVAQTSFC